MDRKPTRRRSSRRGRKPVSENNTVDMMKDNGMSITVCCLGLILIVLIVYLFFEHRNTVIIPNSAENFYNCRRRENFGGHKKRVENFYNCRRRENFGGHKKRVENFQNSDKKLVCLLASWCGHCKTLKPKLDRLEDEHPNINIVRHIDDEDKNKEYEVNGFPTIYCEVNGNRTQFEGQRTVKALVDFYNSCN